MLRRKFLIRVGLLIAAFVVGAVVAIAMLQSALDNIDRTNRDAAVLIDGIQSAGAAVQEIEVARVAVGAQAAPPFRAVAQLNDAMRRIGEHEAARDGAPGSNPYHALRTALPEFLDERGSDPARVSAIGASTRQAVQDLGVALRGYVAAEQAQLGRNFRSLVLGLTVAALAMVNIAVIVLMRTAQVVLRPVAALVDGSRQLARERFDHRVRVDQDDEFGELAHAFNSLAEQLQANEERKVEAIRQLAVTLNHDLNNAMSVIEMQLLLMGRHAAGDPEMPGRLQDIRAMLARMGRTIASLKEVRRVVVTDYTPGQKMLDLERSVDLQPTSPGGMPLDRPA